MQKKDTIEFLRENAEIVENLAREGWLSELQIELCQELGILKRGGE